MSHLCLPRKVLVGLVLAVCVTGSSARAADTPPLSVPLPLEEACTAWRELFVVLIDQHRIAGGMGDDALSGFVLKFIAARDACSAGRYEVGLRMYEAIALGRVHGQPLR